MIRPWAGGLGVVVMVWAAWACAETGKAVIRPTAAGSTIAGTVTFSDSPQGLQVSASITGAPSGKHGFHVHEFGGCGDAGKAAGGHFNPDGAPHGFLPKDGDKNAHAGDMGNIDIGPDGAGALELTLPEDHLSHGAQTVGGRAIILHEKPDDFSQPTGNAGARIGCGTIMITGK